MKGSKFKSLKPNKNLAERMTEGGIQTLRFAGHHKDLTGQSAPEFQGTLSLVISALFELTLAAQGPRCDKK